MRFFYPVIMGFLFLGFDPGLMAQSSDDPYSLEVVYTGDVFANTAGGLDQGIRYLDNMDIILNVNAGSLLGTENTRIFLYGLGNQGGNLSELVGDAQTVNNIEAENSWRIYEAWFQQVFPKARFSLLGGLYDLNSEFDVINTAALFINSSHGIGPDFSSSGVTGPSIFPLTSVAGRVKFSPVNGVIVKAAVLDGVPSDPANTRGTKIYFREDDGLLLAGELSIYGYERTTFSGLTEEDKLKTNLDRGAGEQYKSKIAIGGWTYTEPQSTFEDFPQTDKNWGMYILAETEIFPEWDDATQGLSGFVRAGTSDENTNRFSGYLGSGLVYTGFFKGADEDQLGLAFAMARNSDGYQRNVAFFSETNRAEYNIELTYHKIFNSKYSIQFDTQYIINPDTYSAIDNALVAGVRFIASF